LAAYAPLVAFLIGMIVLRGLLSERGRRLLLDEPNERSLHQRPVPRTGGLAIVTGVLGATALASTPGGLTLGMLALAVVSVLDDWRSLSQAVRLVVHLAVCSAFCAVAVPGLPWTWLAVAALGLGWMANLYNFMDGADGLAGGMAVIGFGFFAAAAMLGGDSVLAWTCASIAAAAGAFLMANFPPARIFMGDMGSVPLGFLAGAVGLLGWNRGLWPVWFPVIIFAPFVVDASTTLARRAWRRERLWQAHRSHYYQRAVLLGWTHRRTVLIEYLLMVACGSCGLLGLGRPPAVQAAVLAFPAALLTAAMIAVDVAWRQRRPG
jgi:UDP-N-acetylmuramyl pentapeptide phosphotransferase/UDP-N-acetylglucosamine-1-phosphate transferase